MDINIFLTFFETNIYLFLIVVPFLSQLWIPVGAMFFILYAWALSSDISELYIFFLIIFASTVSWDILAYLIGKKFSHSIFFQYLSNLRTIKYLYNKSEKFFNKRWEISIFLSRFLVTWVWPTVNYLVWIQKFSFKKFLVNITFWEILYTSELLILWYIFKNSFEEVFDIIYNFWFIVLFIFLLYKVWKKLLKKL